MAVPRSRPGETSPLKAAIDGTKRDLEQLRRQVSAIPRVKPVEPPTGLSLLGSGSVTTTGGTIKENDGGSSPQIDGGYTWGSIEDHNPDLPQRPSSFIDTSGGSEYFSIPPGIYSISYTLYLPFPSISDCPTVLDIQANLDGANSYSLRNYSERIAPVPMYGGAYGFAITRSFGMVQALGPSSNPSKRRDLGLYLQLENHTSLAGLPIPDAEITFSVSRYA